MMRACFGERGLVSALQRQRHLVQQSKARLIHLNWPSSSRLFPSTRHLYHILEASLVFKKDVEVLRRKHDRNHRIVGTALVSLLNALFPVADCSTAKDASLSQLTVELAWHYTTYHREQSREDQVRYAMAEDDARRMRIGLWQEDNPIPPWEWRHC